MPAIDHRKILAHHVGGVGFDVSLDCPPVFSDDVVHILYEPDAQCAADMIKQNNAPNRQILPYYLGREHARGTLHITANPYASSNLPPDPYYTDYTCEVRYQTPAVAATPSARPPASLVERLHHVVVAELALVRRRLRSLAWRRPREAA